MSPSSLVFVALIAIWATYLVVYLSRRREELSMVRAVARFSSRMRILQRRAPGAYLPPERADRISSASLTCPRPLTARSGEAVEHALSVAAGPAIVHADEDAVPASRPEQAPVPAPTRRAVRVWRPLGVLGRLTAFTRRQVRVAALAVVATASLGALGLAVLGLIPWVGLAASLLALGLTLFWLRTRAVAAQAVRRRRAATHRRAKGHVAAVDLRAACPVASEPVQEPRRLVPRDIPFDIAAFDPPASAAPARRPVAVDPLRAESEWEPVPVPLPTYTLKARAQPPAPPAQVPAPVEVDADEVTWDADLRQPRVVNG